MSGFNFSNSALVAADTLYFYACSETVVELKRKRAIKPDINSGFVLSIAFLADANLPHKLSSSVSGDERAGDERREKERSGSPECRWSPARFCDHPHWPRAWNRLRTAKRKRTGLTHSTLKFMRSTCGKSRDLNSKQTRRSLNSSHNLSSDRWQEWEDGEMRDKPSERQCSAKITLLVNYS